jgi:hypothetical protein
MLIHIVYPSLFHGTVSQINILIFFKMSRFSFNEITQLLY